MKLTHAQSRPAPGQWRALGRAGASRRLLACYRAASRSTSIINGLRASLACGIVTYRMLVALQARGARPACALVALVGALVRRAIAAAPSSTVRSRRAGLATSRAASRETSRTRTLPVISRSTVSWRVERFRRVAW